MAALYTNEYMKWGLGGTYYFTFELYSILSTK